MIPNAVSIWWPGRSLYLKICDVSFWKIGVPNGVVVSSLISKPEGWCVLWCVDCSVIVLFKELCCKSQFVLLKSHVVFAFVSCVFDLFLTKTSTAWSRFSVTWSCVAESLVTLQLRRKTATNLKLCFGVKHRMCSPTGLTKMAFCSKHFWACFTLGGSRVPSLQSQFMMLGCSHHNSETPSQRHIQCAHSRFHTGAVNVKVLTSTSKFNLTPNWWASKKRSRPFFDVVKKADAVTNVKTT